tara:strand:- start:121 stop:1173 length:1053 start_codon:yes stop_codon:yes gene_type:complete
MATFDTFYINGENLSTATAVFTDAAMTTLAVTGAYSDGDVIRNQVGSLFNDIALFPDVSHDCNACSTNCTSAVSFSQSFQTAASMQGSVMFETMGAVKVTIQGVGLRPIGVDLEKNGNRYNYFSSTNFEATPQRYNAPSLNMKSYFWSLTGVGACGNWTNGTANLDILHYNPTNGVWEDTGNDILNQTLTNKMTSGFPPIPPTSVGSVAGNLVTYVPSGGTSSVPDFLNIIFETPCGASQGTNKGHITGPILSVECPVTLPSFGISNQTASHAAACAQPANTLTNIRNIGRVRGNPSVLAVGDFVFTGSNGALGIPDGYYKTTGAYLSGVSTSFGSFKIENGVVTEIQSC